MFTLAGWLASWTGLADQYDGTFHERNPKRITSTDVRLTGECAWLCIGVSVSDSVGIRWGTSHWELNSSTDVFSHSVLWQMREWTNVRRNNNLRKYYGINSNINNNNSTTTATADTQRTNNEKSIERICNWRLNKNACRFSQHQLAFFSGT